MVTDFKNGVLLSLLRNQWVTLKLGMNEEKGSQGIESLDSLGGVKESKRDNLGQEANSWEM